uniref:Cadherin domain-containing protein n=1 Tax=Amphimedon queenslandica TaxID=400682 RepID=A0A1X7V4J9_AMPQE
MHVLKVVALFICLLSAALQTRAQGAYSGGSYCNNATDPACFANCPTYTEEAGPTKILEKGLFISDNDVNELFLMQSAIVEVFSDTADFNAIDLNATYLPEGLTQQTMITTENRLDIKVLTIEGEASVLEYQEILRNVTFFINSTEPDSTNRTICFSIFDGIHHSSAACVVLRIILLNDNPPSIVNATGLGEPYVEGSGGVGLLEALNITDDDDPTLFLMEGASINVLNLCNSISDEILVDTSGTNIVIDRDGPCLILSGNDTIANYTQVLLSARYNNTEDEPDITDRTIEFLIYDGRYNASFNVSISSVPINDHPTVVQFADNVANLSEANSSSILGALSPITLTDSDTNVPVYVNSARIEILDPSSGEEFLEFIGSSNISVHVNNSCILINGTETLDKYESLINNTIVYIINDEPPCPLDRNIKITINDDRYAILTVSLIPINNKRPILNSVSPVIFTENDMQFYPFQSLNITDHDNYCLQYGGVIGMAVATLRNVLVNESLMLHSQAEWLHYSPIACNIPTPQLPNPNEVELLNDNATLYYYYCSANDTEIRIIGTASISQYENLLRMVHYYYSFEPTEIARSLELQVSDLSFNNLLNITVAINLINDEPPFVSTDQSLFTFTEEPNSLPVVPVSIVSPSATILDNDRLDDNHRVVSQVCASINNVFSGDELFFDLENDNSSANYILNETETEVCVNFSSCAFANTSCFTTLLMGFMYDNIEDEPDLTPRNITLTAIDDTANLERSIVIMVAITPINDHQHYLILDGTNNNNDSVVVFKEDDQPVLLTSSPRVVDIDVGQKNFTSATITILDADYQYDTISLNTTMVSQYGLVLSNTSTSTYILIEGSATQSAYAHVLSTVTFINTDDEPTPRDRSINRIVDFEVSDDSFTDTSIANITLMPVNDIPTLSVPDVTFNESTRDPVYLFPPDVAIDDSDDEIIEFARVRIESPYDSMDNLTIHGTTDLTITTQTITDPAPTPSVCSPAVNEYTIQQISMTGPLNKTDFNYALSNITFSNYCPGLLTSRRRVSIILFDEMMGFSPISMYINIATVDDPPYCYFGSWPGVTTSSAVYSEYDPPVSIAADFTIQDFDGPHYLHNITLEVTNLDNGNSEVLSFNTTGTNISYRETRSLFAATYILTGYDTFDNYTKVLRTLTYVNNIMNPYDQRNRLIRIMHPDPTFNPCQISIDVININVPPVITLDHHVTYIEDQGPLLASNTTIDITDEDNGRLIRAMIYISNSPTEFGSITDSLTIGSGFTSGGLSITGNGTNSITAVAAVSQLHSVFESLLSNIFFETNDQSTNITRNLTMTVQEFANDPSQPAVIPIYIEQRNDRPVFISDPLMTTATLDDYLPDNNGFATTSLLNRSVVSDPDSIYPPNPDFVGMAIFDYSMSNPSLGVWQTWYNGSWVNFTTVSACSPLFISQGQWLRFHPFPRLEKENGDASITYWAWDGTSTVTCNNNSVRTDVESPVSNTSKSFSYSVTYLNRPPSIVVDSFPLPSITEDSPTNGSIVYNIVNAIATDPDDSPLLGLAFINASNANGRWQYYDNITHFSWVDFPSNLSSAYALHLSMEYMFRFLPNQDFYGQTSVTVHAWDLSNSKLYSSFFSPVEVTPSGAYSPSTLEMTLDVTPGNDPPVISVPNSQITYVENGPSIVIFASLNITDVDNANLTSGVITLSCPDCLHGFYRPSLFLQPTSPDVLEYVTNNDFNVTQVENNTILQYSVLPLASYAASIDDFKSILSSFKFKNIMEEPSIFDRIVSLHVSDGHSLSNTLNVTITMQQINNNPPSIELPFTSINYIEGSGELKLDFNSSDIITDPDESLPFYTLQVTLLSASDEVDESISSSYNALSINVTSYNDSHLLFTGPASLAVFNDITNSISYTNNEDEPGMVSVQVQYSVYDGVYTSTPAILTINIMPINDHKPILDIGSSPVILYQEENPISSPVLIFPDITVSDADVPVTPVLGANVTIENPLDGSYEALMLNSVVPNVEAQYSNATLHIRSNGGAPITTSDVQDALRILAYQNRAEEPNSTPRNITVIVEDALYGGTLNYSDPVSARIDFILANDPPTVLLGQSTVLYTESQDPLLLSPSAVISDVDNTNLAGLLISLSANLTDFSFERLSVNKSLLPSSIELNETNTELVLTGVESLSIYEEVLRTLTYDNEDLNPVTEIRSVNVIPIGVGTGPGHSDLVRIEFDAVNNPPSFDLNGNNTGGINYYTDFTEEAQDPIPIVSGDALLTDVDNSSLHLVSLALSPFLDDEEIQAPTFNSSLLQLHRASQVNLTFTGVGGSAPIASFLEALKALRYINRADEPDTTTRRITFMASDGATMSQPAFTFITINSINDVPQLNLTSTSRNYTISWTENDMPITMTSSPSVYDADSTGFTAVRVGDVNEVSGDLITLNGSQLMMDPNHNNIYIATFPTPLTASALQNLLSTLSFSNIDEEPPVTDRVYCVSISDGFSWSYPACVEIKVIPVNDNAPVISPSEATVTVQENMTNTPYILPTNFTATDLDNVDSHSNLTWAIVSGDDCHQSASAMNMFSFSGDNSTSSDYIVEPLPCRFSIDSNGRVTVVSVLDRETRDLYVLNISVTDGLFTDYASLTVIVSDIDDNPTCFSPQVYNATVSLGDKKGTQLAILTLTDLDSSIPSPPSLHFGPIMLTPSSAGLTSVAFRLDENNGTLTLNIDEGNSGFAPMQSLYELEADFEFGSGSAKQFGCGAVVYIEVPFNAHAPVFTSTDYSFTINENTAIDTPVGLIINATDDDQGSYGMITYSMVTQGSLFKIDSTTGSISVSAAIDFEMVGPTYMFTVSASDGLKNTHVITTNVTANIMDVNEFPPVFNRLDYSDSAVCENVPLGTEVLTVQATDGDAGSFGQIFYSIDSNSISCCFDVNSTTGVIYTNSSIDFDTGDYRRSFYVIATDLGGRVSSIGTFVTITILNDNDHIPMFPNQSLAVAIPENFPVQSPLPSQLMATDGDIYCRIDQCNGAVIIDNSSCRNQPTLLTYAIVSGNGDGLFSIDSTTGVVSVAMEIDHESLNITIYDLIVSVTDGQYTSYANLSVSIINVSEFAPMFEKDNYTASINERVPIGTLVETVLAFDDDNSPFTYSLVGDDVDYFTIGPNSGEVRTAREIDYEMKPVFSLLVVASEVAMPNMSGYANLLIHVNDINDNRPLFDQDEYQFELLENLPPGTSVGTVSASDADSGINADISYSILSVHPPSHYPSFTINSTSGEITSTQSFDREETDEYTFMVAATDTGHRNSSVTVTVRVNDVNDNPSIMNDTILDTPENTPLNTVILTLVSTDADTPPNSHVTYQLVNDFNGNFNITGDKLIVASSLDYEGIQSYNLVVMLTNGNLTSYANVTVNVLDVNDNAPIFTSPSEVSIPEDAPIGSLVLPLSATDADDNGDEPVSFMLADNYTGPFSLDSNLVIVSAGLDRESQMIHYLPIIAFNPNSTGPITTQNLTITLIDVNDNIPQFSADPILFSVLENHTLGQSVGVLTATDIDQLSNAKLTYTLSQPDPSLPFAINPLTGEINLTSSLDYELVTSYSFNAIVTDGGEPALFSTALVIVNVSDINDNSPIFTSDVYNVSVLESIKTSSVIIQLSASDVDSGSNADITFSLIDSSLPFYINGSYVLLGASSLDRESVSEYTFNVVATDGGHPSRNSTAQVIVTVQDVNDNSPVIDLVYLNDSIPENTQIGTVVAIFNVTDADIGPNALTTLTLSGEFSHFEVDQDGVVRLRTSLDFDTGNTTFNIVLVARNNNSTPRLTSTYPFSISLSNINDNAPMIEFGKTVVSFDEGINEVPLNVGVNISDADDHNEMGFTRIYDAKIEFINPNPLEISSPFSPTAAEDPSDCPLEDKTRKLQSCGFTATFELQTNLATGSLRLYPGTIQTNNGATLVLDGSNHYAYMPVTNSFTSFSMLSWVWYTQTSSPSTIFSYVNSDYTVFSAVCYDADLVFTYYNATQHNVTFRGSCSALTDQWHHLALTINQLQGQPVLSVFIDGTLNDRTVINAPQDDDRTKRLFIGVSPIGSGWFQVADYFTGRLHRLAFSSSVITEQHINCVIGCGVYLYSSSLNPPVQYHYDYSSRQLYASGVRVVQVYEQFLDTITFVTAFSEPMTLEYNLDYTVTDGVFNSIPMQLNITLNPTNDGPPVLALNGDLGTNFNAEFVEEGGPVAVVNSSLTLTDVDSVSSPYVVNATILYSEQAVGEEVLAVSNIPQGMSAVYSGYSLILSGSLTIDQFQLSLRTLTYDNYADEPQGDSRIISIVVNDSPWKSNTANASLSIRYVNDPPVLSVKSSTAEYAEGDGLVPLLIDANVTDNDNTTLVSALVTFFPPDGSLEALVVDTSDTDITSVYANGTLVLSGEDILDSYAAVLSSLSYINNKTDNITGGTRVFSFYLFDSSSTGHFVQSTSLFIQGVNDPPIVDLNGDDMAGNSFTDTFTEDTDMTIPAASPTLSLIDVDSSTLEYVRIEFLRRPDGEQESILLDTQGGAFSFTSNGNVYTLRPGSLTMPSVDQFQQVLRTLRYHNTAEEPTQGLHSLSLIVNDGIDSSVPVYINITVKSVNDPPYVDLDTSQNGTGFSGVFIEESSTPTELTSSNVLVTDNDANATIVSLTVSINELLDGFSESIVSLDPNITLPAPTLQPNSVLSYTITPIDGAVEYISYLLSVLAYDNSRLEPTRGQRQIIISLYDGFNRSNDAVSLITVETLNEHVPNFTQSIYSASIYENQPNGTLLARVMASDGDSGTDGRITYSIVSVSPSVGMNRFTIGSDNGRITAVSLDREDIDMYNITVAATDSGPDPNTATALVTVEVLNENDNSPYFPQSVYHLSIPEDTPTYTEIDVVSAIDPDIPDQLFYQLISDTFQILNNGTLRLIKSVDADGAMTVYNITITAIDLFGHTGDTIYTITVTDVNDNTPSFSQDSYQGSVPENLLDEYVATVSATDLDSTSNGEISYSFENPDTLQYFTIDNTTGVIRTASELNREEQQSYTLTVLATDAGDIPLTGSATVDVSVLDINDNTPSFSATEYSASVLENIPNVYIVTVNATDPDNGSNGSITYSLSNTVTLFRIDGVTGDIYAIGSLDRETTSSQVFVVYAADGGNPSRTSSAAVNVSVIDVNDNSPMFIGDPYSGSIPENEAGYNILTVEATDADYGSNSQITYILQTHTDLFSIDSSTGQLRSLVGLDFESRCFYQLQVVAVDGGSPPRNSTTLIDINVIPHNDHPPTFSSPSYSVQIFEELPNGTFVASVFAVDNDTTLCELGLSLGSGSGSGLIMPGSLAPMTSSITYSLLNALTDFQIDPDTGNITTRTEIDREMNSSYLLTVTATEAASNLTSTATVYVSIIDINDNPPIFLQRSYSREIPESTPVGTQILQVMATDADFIDQGNLRYQILNFVPLFNISSRTGAIYLAEAVDFETIESTTRTFSVEVFDSGNVHFDLIPVTISIIDTNDLPPYIATVSSSLTFIEGSISLGPFPDMNITDPDVLQNLYSANVTLATSTNNTATNCLCTNISVSDSCTLGCVEFLQLDPKEFPGTITQSSDGHSLLLTGNYSIEAYRAAIVSILYVNLITHPHPTPREVSLIVNDGVLDSNILINSIDIVPLNQFSPVIDLNGPDVDGINYNITFNEQGTAVNIASSQATITDNDTMSALTRLTVSLLNPQDGNDESIRLKTGTILPSGITMHESSTAHSIILQGTGSLSDYTELIRQLEYINTAPEPQDTQRIINFQATEHHLSSAVAVTLVTIVTRDDNMPSIVASPPMINYATLYYETSGAVGVVTSDAYISDNDVPAYITELQIFVFVSPSVYDRITLNGNISSDISVSHLSNYHLVLSGTSTVAEYTKALKQVTYLYDREEFESFPITKYIYLQVSDTMHSVFAVTRFTFVPQNDQQPQFNSSLYTASLSESTPVGSFILHGQINENSPVGTSVGVSVAASDGDLPSNQITYYISGKDADRFTIDQSTSVILTAAVFDAEITTALSFNVTAEDSYGSVVQSSSAPVSIVVIDINDNAPLFDLPFYQLNVSEDTPVGQSLLTVSASDSDVSSINSALTYSLRDIIDMSGSGQSLLPFTINSSTGVITLTMALDYEKEQMFDFIVTCQDSGTPSRQSNVPVTINVADANDNAPVFSQDMYPATVPEDASFGSTILTVQARDVDSGSNSRIVYEITGTVTFIIDATTGVISLVGELDYETETSIVFDVLARDSGIQEQVSTAVVNITVTNVNDNPPSFLNQVYNFTVYENTVEPQFTVLAQDPDNSIEVLNPLNYSLLSSCLSGAVAISSGDGVLSLLQPFDRESLSNCVLVVSVSDGLHSSNVIVNMRILDVNDNQPSFTQSIYTESIPEIYPVNTFVTTVTATDPDEGENGTVTYAIVGGNVGEAFTIMPSNGMIRVNGPLDHETVSSYNLTLVASDGGGLTGTSHLLITVTDSNDESPILVISQSSYTYTEEAGLVSITSSLQLIEPDLLQSNIEEALIILSVETSCQDDEHTFACPSDFDCFYYCSEGLALNKSLYNSLSVSYSTNTSTITISGAGSPATYESLLSSLHYFNGFSEPYPGGRMVELSVFDGVHHSNTLAINITVSVIDDNCPVITSSLSQIDFTEGDHYLDIGLGLGLMLTDSDQHNISHQIISGVQVTLLNGNSLERLTVNTTGLPLMVQDMTLSNGRAIEISGPASIATYQNVLRTLRYENPVPEPTKGLRLGSIALLSEQCPMYSLNYSVNVITVNDNAPVIATNATMVDYREGSGSLLISMIIDFTLTDLDTDFPIHNATLILTPGDIRDSGHESLSVDTSLIPAGIYFEASGGQTQLSFVGPSSVSNYQELIRSLSYSNTASEPTLGNRTLTITVSDGAFTTQTTLTIRVLTVDDNPLQLNGTMLIFPFYEGNTTIELYGFLLYDPDEGAQVYSLNISLSDSLGDEEISVTAFGDVITSSDTISITTVDSISTYQAILDSLSYSYTTINDSEPLPGPRELTITATNGAFPSSSVSTIINVIPINNNPPMLSFGGNTEAVFTEAAGSATVLPVGAINQPVITDYDNNEIFFIHEATVRLVGALDGTSEKLNLSMSFLPNGSNAAVTPHSITISGPAPLLIYQQILSTITYTNTAPEPSMGNRSIQYRVNDGIFSSDIIQSTVSVSLINDNPLILTCDGQTNQFTEGSGEAIFIGPSVSVSDLDSDHVISGADVMIVNGFSGDFISLPQSAVSGLHVTVGVNDTSLRIEGNGTAAEYQ